MTKGSVRWRGLIDDLAARSALKLARVDLLDLPDCKSTHLSASVSPFGVESVPVAAIEAKRRFCLIMIKPSHYDDDGYVIQWLRSSMPSNTLAVLFGLATDCAARGALGPGIELDIEALDETTRASGQGRSRARSGAPVPAW